MANMSYVRMENTLRDLQDAEEHLGDRDLSVSERQARENLVALCVEIAQRWGDVDLDDDDDDEDERDICLECGVRRGDHGESSDHEFEPA